VIGDAAGVFTGAAGVVATGASIRVGRNAMSGVLGSLGAVLVNAPSLLEPQAAKIRVLRIVKTTFVRIKPPTFYVMRLLVIRIILIYYRGHE
jgi:hypothetical protein